MANPNATLNTPLTWTVGLAAVLATLLALAWLLEWGVVLHVGLPALVAALWLSLGAIVLASSRARGDERLQQLSQRVAVNHEAIPVGLVTIDFDAKVHAWNPAAERIFGWSRDEVLGKPLPIVRPESWSSVMERLTDARAGKDTEGIERLLLHKDGHRIEARVSGTAIRDDAGVALGACVIVEDLSEHRRIAEALATSEHRLRFIIEHTTDSIYIKDLEGRYVLANPVASDVIAGMPMEELLGKRDDDIFAPETVRRVREADTRVLSRDLPETFELPVTSLHGQSGVYLSTKFPFRSPTGELLGLIGIARDITARKQLELTLKQQYDQIRDLAQLKADLVNAVTHDLRSPLTAILGYAELLQDSLHDDERERLGDFLAHIVKNTHRLEGMVEDLLDFARFESGSFVLVDEEVDFRRLVVDMVESHMPQALASGVALRTELPDAPLHARLDVARMQRVLANLIGNALKFTPSGGEVRVRAAIEDGRLQCAVTDTGVGIAAEDVPRLFQRFSQLEEGRRARRGLGLGLWICKALVEAHGGAIGVTSEPNRGSTFWFSLPLIGREEPDDSSTAAARPSLD